MIYVIIVTILVVYFIFLEKYFYYLKIKHIDTMFDTLHNNMKKEREILLTKYEHLMKN